jgi:hypothetical protein
VNRSRSRTTALWALPPALLAVFPLLSLFTSNQTDLEVSVLWRPLLLSIAVTAVVYVVLVLVTRSAAKASALTSLLAVGFLYFGLFPASDHTWFLALWLAGFAGLLVVVARTKRNLTALAIVALAAGSATALPQVASLALYHAHHTAPAATDARLWPTVLQLPADAPGPLPDIYVIVPDDYARSDVLKTYFHYDNSAFIDGLQQRGFVIADDATSPYSDSESNIASLVNLDYLSRFDDVLGPTSEDVRPVQRVIQDNRAARLLAPLGYDYVHLDTDEVTFAGGNPDISRLSPPDTFRSLWLQQTLLRVVDGAVGFDQQARDDRFRDSIQSVFRQLQDRRPGSRPTFVLFHTLLPHDPYVYDAKGRPVTFPGTSEQDLANSLGRRYYRDQLEYTSRLLLDSVDAILAHASSPPVIVLQSDEGFQANDTPWGEATMQDIRVKGLSAFYLPGVAHPQPPSPPNSVNDLRLVFNTYLGSNFPMLPAHSYPEGDHPYQYREFEVR